MVDIAPYSRQLRESPYPVKVIRVENHPDFSKHKHPFWEIVLVTSGTAIHHVRKTSFSISRGDVFVINNKDIHAFSGAQNLCLYNILFDYDLLKMDQWETRDLFGFQALFHFESRRQQRQDVERLLHLNSTYFGQATALVGEIEQSMRERLPCWKMIVEGHFKHLIVLLSRCYDNQSRVHDKTAVYVSKALNFLEGHFREDIDLEQLIAVSGVSRRSFFRIFKKATDSSPFRYLEKLRIEHACNLLRTTEEAITQIAFNSGFSDSNYFTREFRRIVGETPSAYRKRWAD